MTTKEIQAAICKAEINKGNFVAENFNYFFAGELDVISLAKSGYASEFEVKVSRNDFKADAKKSKWQWYENTMLQKAKAYCPNYFSYVCEVVDGKPLIGISDIKEYHGLIHIINGIPVVIKKPKLIHKHKHDTVKLLSKMLRINNCKHYLGAQPMTIKNREIQERKALRLQNI